ncbi:MAG: XdhC family protein [Acidiferrobacteraceae bacterium]
MESPDLITLDALLAWQAEGQNTVLVTVLATYGSSPRPPGALFAVSRDGRSAGSVSGGCVETELCERFAHHWPASPEILRFGDRDQAERRRLPCGATLELLIEPSPSGAQLRLWRDALHQRRPIEREFDVASGLAQLTPARHGPRHAWDGQRLRVIYGPLWRLLLIGATEPARYVAEMASVLDFEVIVCEPREDYRSAWPVAGARVETLMPDDFVRALAPDARSAVLALAHDPRLDDLGIIEALGSDAAYVGALGSSRTHAKRCARLRELGLERSQIARLHGPVGLPIGSRTPPEIALAILSELVSVRSRSESPKLPAANVAALP